MRWREGGREGGREGSLWMLEGERDAREGEFLERDFSSHSLELHERTNQPI